MKLIKLDNIKKYYGDKLILDIDNLEIIENQRVGIVGENGAGKTTLLKIIIGEIKPDEGNLFLSNSYSYINQSEECIGESTKGKFKKLLSVPDRYSEYLSGGEKVKIKINEAFTKNSSILIADEPTSNLDAESIKKIENMIKCYKGALLLVSHDREFLDKLCNYILEIENGKVKLYKGNYSKYIMLKEEERELKKRGYDRYIEEKRRLEKAIIVKEEKRNSIRKTPKRMGNSEARLHKMGGQKGKKNLDGNIKALRSRVEHLEVKEKPRATKEIKIKINKNKEMNSNTVIEIKDFNLSINNKTIIKNCNFKISKGKKVALIGKNGSGKTTLIKRILFDNNQNIRLSKYISIGYFDQNQDVLNDNMTILENIKESSSYDEGFIRINLDGFGFKGDDVYKIVSVLSGGEKVKVALCKVILSDNNTLILDEPTNYLDIKSIESLQNALKNTDKTVLLISHDRRFISYICNYILDIKNNELKVFDGSYEEYIREKENESNKKVVDSNERKRKEQIFILENKLSALISRLSIEKDIKIKEKLNVEYEGILKELNSFK